MVAAKRYYQKIVFPFVEEDVDLSSIITENVSEETFKKKGPFQEWSIGGTSRLGMVEFA